MSEKREAEEEFFPAEQNARVKSAYGSSDSDIESINSCQGYETVVLGDSDDNSPIHSGIECDAPDVEEPKPIFDLPGDSDSENLNFPQELGKASSETDSGLLGDESNENPTSQSSTSDVDPGLQTFDYVDFSKCVMCHSYRKDITYPYCCKCFTLKKINYPIRRKSQETVISSDSTSSDKTTDIADRNSFMDLVDGADTISSVEEMKKDSGLGNSGALLSAKVVEGASSKPSTSRGFAPDLCRICFSKPENGLFVHKRCAHIYGCYSCAKIIGYRNASCPICRRTNLKVVKLYV